MFPQSSSLTEAALASSLGLCREACDVPSLGAVGSGCPKKPLVGQASGNFIVNIVHVVHSLDSGATAQLKCHCDLFNCCVSGFISLSQASNHFSWFPCLFLACVSAPQSSEVSCQPGSGGRSHVLVGSRSGTSALGRTGLMCHGSGACLEREQRRTGPDSLTAHLWGSGRHMKGLRTETVRGAAQLCCLKRCSWVCSAWGSSHCIRLLSSSRVSPGLLLV